MNCRFNFRFTAPLRRAITCALLFAGGTAFAQDYPTAINYQGQLFDQGQPVTGNYEITFRIFDAQIDGLMLAAPVTLSGVQVLGGQFFAEVDFGSDVFAEPHLWIEISAKSTSDASGSIITFAPRQKISSAPRAINSDRLDGMDALELATVGAPLFKQVSFSQSVGPAGQQPAVLSSMSVTAPYSGQLVLRARGVCVMLPLASGANQIVMAVGINAADAFADSNQQTWGVAMLPLQAEGLHQLPWSVERTIPVEASQHYSIVTVGRHDSGAVSNQCSGTFSAELIGDVLPD